eukprot:6432555-Pyramimonas_sp.AAC.1
MQPYAKQSTFHTLTLDTTNLRAQQGSINKVHGFLAQEAMVHLGDSVTFMYVALRSSRPNVPTACVKEGNLPELKNQGLSAMRSSFDRDRSKNLRETTR